MTDKTSRDIRLGDLSAIESTSTQEPQLGNVDASQTRPSAALPGTGRRPRAEPLPPVQRAAPNVQEQPQGSTSWSVMFLGTAVLVLVAAVVMLVMQQRELSASLKMLEAKAQESVATLESRVASTSTTLKSTDSETQRSLNILGADISSLNKTLGKLAEALEKEAEARAAVDTDVQAVAAEMRKADQAGVQADTLRDTRLKAIGENLEQVNSKLKALSEGVARLERNGDASQLRADVAVLGASIRQLEEDHEKRLKSIEQSAGSSDAFRRQVNATIDRLNQQVSELYQRR